MRHRTRTALIVSVLAVTCQAGAQPSTRQATTIAALRAAPVFFHGKQIAVLGSIVESRGMYRLDAPAAAGQPAASAPDRGIYVYWRERPSRSDGEIRGEFWDLGRLSEGDPRFTAYDFKPLLENVTDGRWPGRDQLFVVLGGTAVEPVLPDPPSLRAIALAPDKYEGRGVTISGRFRGRNLHADLPSPLPTPTKWDFVVQSADASMWIGGLRPRGKDFELDPSVRVDTGRWVQIAGTVRREGSRVWIEGREIALSSPPKTEPDDAPVDMPVTAPEPPPTVVFSAPVAEDTDVAPNAVIRIQFSRDMDARTFKDRVRVAYDSAKPGMPPPTGVAQPVFTYAYNVGSRGIEVKFTKPLERLQRVRIDLLEGIAAVGGDALKPWTLTFTTGG
jgi:Big-like domain-containing protein